MAGADKVEITRALEQELGVLLRRLRKVMEDRAKLVHPDLNYAAYGSLMMLSQGPHRSSEISDYYGLDKGAVSRMVRHLEELGFIERFPDPDDGRAHLLRLTDAGNARLETVAEERRTGFHERIADWSVSDLKGLVKSLRRYNESLE